MSIFNIVKYDEAIKYELVHPASGDGLGIIFSLVSSASDQAKAIYRKQIKLNYALQRKGKTIDIDEGEAQIIERLSASIVGWDWADQEFREGEGAPEFNKSNIADVLTVDWIFDQISKQVNDIQNFTNP